MNGSVARRYAKALLEIGLASRSADALQVELARLAGALTQSSELAAALANPSFKLSQRRRVLAELANQLGLSPAVRNLALLLLDRGRIGELPGIAREHRALVDQAAGRVRVAVTSPGPLDQNLEKRLLAALEGHTGKTIILEKREDAELLGGITCRIGDVVYDGSLRTQLGDLRRRLLAQ